jgi:hypothetical protein
VSGAGLAGTETFTGINVSMAGGGDILISGYYFNESPALNTPLLTTTDLGGTISRTGTALTEDDQFQSAPSMGKLSYSHPSIADLFNLDITDFEGYDYVDFTLSFVDSETADVLECSTTSNCRVRYNWSYTPLLLYMSPPVMYPGMIATVALNAQSTMSYKQDDAYPVDIRIDGELFDFDEGAYGTTTDTSIGSNTRVSGIQGSRERNDDLHPAIKFFGAGYAREWHLSSAVCGVDATSYEDCYTAKVLPTI